MHQDDLRLVQVTPSPRQLRQQHMELYAFVHFTVNTFTSREWGDGTEPEACFNPTAFDADQWVDALRAAHMKGLILTCKHHDGFCLWPSQYTNHTVARSPFRAGKGDVIREVADACRRGGIRFGIYLSPWDRNCALYGQGKAYDDYFVAQLTELLTQYGDIFCVWFDGACGEGPNGKKQRYDWPRYYETIRRLQPDACISVCGPDIRWCGNEAGDTREAEWNVVPRRTMDTEKIAKDSQQSDDDAFRQRTIRAQDRDLGSRELLATEPELIWYPAEVNTSIRPGWFYHEEEDTQVRPLDELIRIYERSVGGNAMFLLNIPPDRRGLFHEADVQRLHEFGAYLEQAYGNNLLQRGASLACTQAAPGHPIQAVLQEGDETYFRTPDGVTQAEIILRWPQEQSIRRVVLRENLLESQRIEQYALDMETPQGWREIVRGRVVGNKRIIDTHGIRTAALRLRVLDARVSITLSFLGVYS